MYTRAWIDSAEKRAQRARFVCAGFLVLGLIIAAFGLAFRIEAILIGGLILGSATAYFWHSMVAAPCARYARYLADADAGQKRTSTVTLVGLDARPHVSEDGVTVWDVAVASPEGEEMIYYWDAALDFPTLEGGESLTLTSFGRYIISLSNNH